MCCVADNWRLVDPFLWLRADTCWRLCGLSAIGNHSWSINKPRWKREGGREKEGEREVGLHPAACPLHFTAVFSLPFSQFIPKYRPKLTGQARSRRKGGGRDGRKEREKEREGEREDGVSADIQTESYGGNISAILNEESHMESWIYHI